MVHLYDQPLDWVDEFKYLGFPIYANKKYHKQSLPLDLHSVHQQVVGPTASVLHPKSTASLLSPHTASPSILHDGRRQSRA